MSKCNRLCTLQMCITRHNSFQIVLCALAECFHEIENFLFDRHDLFLHVKTHIQCNLIISGSRRMKTFSGIADALGQNLLYIHMNILIIL